MSRKNTGENTKENFDENILKSSKLTEKSLEQATYIPSSVNTLKINDVSESNNENRLGESENLLEENIEPQEVKIIPEPKPLKELIIDSVVSSKNFFLNNLTKKVSDDETILSYKLQLKVNQEYKDIMQNTQIRPSKYGEKMISTSSALALPEKQEKSQQDFKTPNLLGNKLTRGHNHSELPTNPSIEKIYDKSIIREANELIVKEESKLLNNIPEKYKIDTSDGKNDNLVLSLYKNQTHIGFRKNKLVNPEWHAPWKLYRVISGHTGWVRCIDVDPTNNWFVTGSNDRLIKFWDLASGKLKLSLTGHINTVRGVVVSPRHPYLFSCSEDKTVKCWDLEQNKVVRHYHGHLSGVYTIALHPTLDIIVTGGRDCVARVWDLRSRNQIFCLEGHNNTIASVVTQEFNPQIITGSHDSTIKLWDMRNGKCLNTLTHHKKSIRSLAVHDQEYTFISGKT
jgi:pleiotropic regulator 1